MKNQPTKIYLNIGADGECQDFEELVGVSWSDSRINDDDLEYISVSSVLARIEELIEPKEDLRKIVEEVFNEQPRELFLMNANSVIDTRIPKEPKQELERGITITHVGKQETLEEASERVVENLKDFDSKRFTKAGFKLGAKWQQEKYETEQALKLQEIELKWMEYFSEGYDKGIKDSEKMYSEEEVLELLKEREWYFQNPENIGSFFISVKKWFEQFKK
jgi:hypothetical protein